MGASVFLRMKLDDQERITNWYRQFQFWIWRPELKIVNELNGGAQIFIFYVAQKLNYFDKYFKIDGTWTSFILSTNRVCTQSQIRSDLFNAKQVQPVPNNGDFQGRFL